MIQVIPINGIPKIKEGSDLPRIILKAIDYSGLKLMEGDILVIAQSIVSKAEGRIVKLSEVNPSPLAKLIGSKLSKDPKMVHLILGESKDIRAYGDGRLIAETKHGLVCANAGIDKSNAGINCVTLLPTNPDESARKIMVEIQNLTGIKKLAVIITDTHGRPFRIGAINIAIGSSGITPIMDYRGKKDLYGYILKSTTIAVIDALAAIAGLVMGESNEGTPVVLIRGYKYTFSHLGASFLIRDRKRDLFYP